MSIGTPLGIVASIPTVCVDKYATGYDIILFNHHGWVGEDKFDYVHLMIDKFSSVAGDRIPNNDGNTAFDLDDLEAGKLDEYILGHKTASLSEYKWAAQQFMGLGIDTTIHHKYWIYDRLFDYTGPIDACEVCGKNEKYEPPMEKKKGIFGIDIDVGFINCEAKSIPHKWYKWDRAKTLSVPRYEVCYDVVVNGIEYEVAPYGSTKNLRLPHQFDTREDAEKECDRLIENWQKVFTNAVIQGC